MYIKAIKYNTDKTLILNPMEFIRLYGGETRE